MVRVRYTQTENELLSNAIHTLDGVVRASIKKTSEGFFEYSALKYSHEQWVTMSLGKTKNLTVAKSKVKVLLKTLGAQFKDEIRRK